MNRSSVHEVDCTDSISLPNKLSVFLLIGSFLMQSFQFTNGLNLLSHYICFCSIPREDLDGALFWETRRLRYEIPMVKMSLMEYQVIISRTSQIQFQARDGGKKRNFVDKRDPIWEEPFTTRITLSWIGSKNFPANIFLEKRNGQRSGQPFMFGQKETY